MNKDLTVSLDFDDFSPLNNRMDLLLRLKEHYPDLKVTMFTILFDAEREINPMIRIQKDSNLEIIKQNLDWIETVPHGLTHMDREFENCDAKTMRTYLENIEDEFKKIGLNITKGFKAPFWLWNKDVVKELDRKGWWGAVDRNQPDMLRTKRYYEYTHSIDEPFWLSNDRVVNLHGHISLPSKNNLEDNLLNLMKIPTHARWEFASHYVKES